MHRDPFFWIANNDGAISYHIVLHNNPRGVHFFSLDDFAGHEIETILEDGEHELVSFARLWCPWLLLMAPKSCIRVRWTQLSPSPAYTPS